MKVEVRDAGNVRIVDLEGKLVLRPTEEVKDTVQKLIAEGHGRIVINLRGVPYIDSSGLGELVVCKKRAIEHHAQLRILRPVGRYNLAVEGLLEMTFSPLFDDETKAVGSF